MKSDEKTQLFLCNTKLADKFNNFTQNYFTENWLKAVLRDVKISKRIKVL